MRTTLTAMTVLFVAWVTGCESPAVNTVSFQRQRLEAVPYASAYDAAERALRERFRILEQSRESGVIRGVALDTSADVTPAATGRPVSDTLGGPPRVRRTAVVRVRQRDGDAEVYCQVLIQENTADSVRMLTRERDVYDQPYETPADREASTSREQNAVWRDRRRDRGMERDILASVREVVMGRDHAPGGR